VHPYGGVCVDSTPTKVHEIQPCCDVIQKFRVYELHVRTRGLQYFNILRLMANLLLSLYAIITFDYDYHEGG
jgi:hypothetical protein